MGIVFECFQCGECCSHLGLVHIITREMGNYRYTVHNKYTGEDTEVVVDPDKIELFEDRKIFERLPFTCPFFRHHLGSENAYCTVHATRPEICRDYGCWRPLILDHRGRRAGRVKYIRTLHSEDEILTSLWERCVDKHNEKDDQIWEDAMIKMLRRAGYTVRK